MRIEGLEPSIPWLISEGMIIAGSFDIGGEGGIEF